MGLVAAITVSELAKSASGGRHHVPLPCVFLAGYAKDLRNY